jgi:hypothetical protein
MYCTIFQKASKTADRKRRTRKRHDISKGIEGHERNASKTADSDSHRRGRAEGSRAEERKRARAREEGA